MCRWVTVLSNERLSLSNIVLAPSQSLVRQAKDASYHPGYGLVNNAPMNGDGFGVGWYHSNKFTAQAVGAGAGNDGTVSLLPATEVVVPNGSLHSAAPSQLSTTQHADEPEEDDDVAVHAAVFKDIYPAWNNENLREICTATASNCIMAHVRAASSGTGISHQNCHPFKAGRLLFCHNGRIDQFSKLLKRKFLAQLVVSDEAYKHIKGTTDSECIFGLILSILENDGRALPQGTSPLAQTKPFGASRLVAALKHTLHQIELFLESQGMDGPQYYSTCNFSLTDGETMVVTRYCDKSPDVPPPSLYFAFGETKSLYKELTTEEGTEHMDKIPYSTMSSRVSRASFGTDNPAETSTEVSLTSDGGFSTYDEEIIYLENHQSHPGKVLVDVDPSTATFIVASNPLTRTHTWNPMPQNSIMWCTVGKHPELRLLRRRRNSMY